MMRLLSTLALALSLTLPAGLAVGQTLPTLGFAKPAPQPSLPVISTARDDVIKGDIDDWQIRCMANTGQCFMFQLATDFSGTPISEVTIAPINGHPTIVGTATIVMPLGVVLDQQLAFSIDNGKADRTPFQFCVQKGCFAQIGFTRAQINALKAGGVGNMVVYALGANGPVQVKLSLTGFTKAFDTLSGK